MLACPLRRIHDGRDRVNEEPYEINIPSDVARDILKDLDMERMLPMLVFGLAVVVFALLKPGGARVFLGLFFLLMALAVNATLVVVNPDSFVALGKDSLVPFYRWVFTHVVAMQPAGSGALVVAFQVATGLLILSKGRGVRLGLLAGIAFLLVITPFGLEELPSPVMALAMRLLLRLEWHENLPEMLHGLLHLRASPPPLKIGHSQP